MSVKTRPGIELDPPDSPRLRLTFFVLWFVDLVAATLFFVVPYATELNPVTVFFYGLFGLPGVALAACCYAAIVVAVGNYLPDPLDVRFVAAVVLLYVFFAVNNVVLLLFRTALVNVVPI